MFVETFYDAVAAARTILHHDPKIERVVIGWPGTSFPKKPDTMTAVIECQALLQPHSYVLTREKP